MVQNGQQEAQTLSTETAGHERSHPSAARYWLIAIILAVITIVEVAIVYQDFLRDVLIPTLVILSVAKFVLVAMFFMHLRFDSRLFSTFFVTGILLATTLTIVLLALFRVIV